MTPDQIQLLHRLVKTAAVDQTRVFSATWSQSRLRTVLIDKIIASGHQIMEPEVVGTPLAMMRAATHHDRQAAAPDLKVLSRSGDKLLFVDVLVASRHATERPTTVADLHTAVGKLASGATDVLILSADGDSYEALRHIDTASPHRVDPRSKTLASVMPTLSAVSGKSPHHATVGDISLEVIGLRSSAFGTARVACAVYVQWGV
jgi:hypothetical protein